MRADELDTYFALTLILGLHLPADRELFCLYLAVQMARTPKQRTLLIFRRDVTAYADGREVDHELMIEHLTRERTCSHWCPTATRGGIGRGIAVCRRVCCRFAKRRTETHGHATVTDG
ncbi:hypothetical protein ACWGLF_41435 [Streptomyces puniciscabiei]